ncbi:MAG: hypothetical protein SVX43_10370 [Cyanobacteriota bacterium]|nr:hypothetical protein [Cyanobacteriota bacterium]
MKRLKYRIQTVVFSLCLGASLLGAPLPARALALKNPLDGLLEQLQAQWQSLQKTLEESLAEQFSGLSEALGSDLQAAVGALGLPDVLGARKEIEGSQPADGGGLYSEGAIANEIDRLTTRLSAAASLSQSGQDHLLKSLQQTQQTVDGVAAEATAAQDEVVTQNVMKRIARQNQLTSSLLGALRADQIQHIQQLDLTNTNLANISESLDGQARRDASENLGAGLDLLRTSSFVGLY